MRQLKPFDTDEKTFLTDLTEPEASIFIATIDEDSESLCIQYEPGDTMRHNGGAFQVRVTKDELRLTLQPSTALTDLAATPIHLIEGRDGHRLLIEFGSDDVFISVSGLIPSKRLDGLRDTINRFCSH